MTLHPIDLARISRALNDPDAIARQTADDTFDASPRDTAETILTVLVGAVVVAMILFAWIAKEGM